MTVMHFGQAAARGKGMTIAAALAQDSCIQLLTRACCVRACPKEFARDEQLGWGGDLPSPRRKYLVCLFILHVIGWLLVIESGVQFDGLKQLAC